MPAKYAPVLTFLAATLFVPALHATRIPLVGVRTADLETGSRHKRRDAVFGTTTLNDSGDVTYLISITVGGESLIASIDTGSSDLWVQVTHPIPSSQSTGLTDNITYAKGFAAGPIKTVDVSFAGYNITSQAFIEADDNTSGSPGIIGLGPASGSTIFNDLHSNLSAAPILDRIFANGSVPAYITTTLGRSTNDPSNSFEGDLTIGEVLPGYEAVLSQPKLLVTATQDPRNQHWQTLLDAQGMSVNGKNLTLPKTSVKTTTNSAQLTVVFDNGFSLPQLPKPMVDAIYNGVAGAQFDKGQGLWMLPCNSEINVTFYFSGRAYPIHPLDTVTTLGDPKLSDGCVGAFQPITFNSDSQLDVILGMAFLRNVYMLNSFGSMSVSNSASGAKDIPYVQLLALTNDTAAAHHEFVKVRGLINNGVGSARLSRRGWMDGVFALFVSAIVAVVL